MQIATMTNNGSAHKARVKNENLQTRLLEPTAENRAMLKKYNQLAADINLIPSRLYGLRMNFRKRDIPARVDALLTERDEKMVLLLEMEKTLFPKEA